VEKPLLPDGGSRRWGRDSGRKEKGNQNQAEHIEQGKGPGKTVYNEIEGYGDPHNPRLEGERQEQFSVGEHSWRSKKNSEQKGRDCIGERMIFFSGQLGKKKNHSESGGERDCLLQQRGRLLIPSPKGETETGVSLKKMGPGRRQNPKAFSGWQLEDRKKKKEPSYIRKEVSRGRV